MSKIKLFINTGGIGNRLLPLTKDIPKPLIEICGKPVLHHLVDWGKSHGVNEFVMLNGYKYEKIIEYFGNGDKFDVSIIHSNEPNPRGSGGAIKFAQKHADDKFFYISGDLISEVDLIKMRDFHEKKNSQMTVFLHESSHPNDSDILKVDSEGQIIRFVSKNEDHTGAGNLGNAGLALMELDIFDLMNKEVFNFENYLYQRVLDNQKRFYGYITDEFIHDMGTFERLKKCEDFLKNKLNNEVTI
ncbi:nucleotidyltransferase family protein [Candidatus Pacearchaeota archaeon]|nr:nucleotidyltransferase family protein [Candidatus Pacearchaeota archaeon]